MANPSRFPVPPDEAGSGTSARRPRSRRAWPVAVALVLLIAVVVALHVAGVVGSGS